MRLKTIVASTALALGILLVPGSAFAASPDTIDNREVTQQAESVTNDVGALVTCTKRAGITPDYAGNRYKVSGGLVSCNAVGTIRVRCKPVHRHSLSWHSHAWAFDITRGGVSGLSITSGWIGGTHGDAYKTNCNYWFNGVSFGSLESPTINL